MSDDALFLTPSAPDERRMMDGAKAIVALSAEVAKSLDACASPEVSGPDLMISVLTNALGQMLMSAATMTSDPLAVHAHCIAAVAKKLGRDHDKLRAKLRGRLS